MSTGCGWRSAATIRTPTRSTTCATGSATAATGCAASPTAGGRTSVMLGSESSRGRPVTVATRAGKNRYVAVFFAANGFGPYACFECGEDVDFDDVVIHHVDEDQANASVENLVPAHAACH